MRDRQFPRSIQRIEIEPALDDRRHGVVKSVDPEGCLVVALSPDDGPVPVGARVWLYCDPPGGQEGQEASCAEVEPTALEPGAGKSLDGGRGADEEEEPLAEKSERRGLHRLPIRIPLHYRRLTLPPRFQDDETLRRVLSRELERPGGGGVFSARTANLSGSGLLIDTDWELQLGDGLWISLRLDEFVFQAAARVVRVFQLGPPHRYGVEFLDLPVREQDRLIQYVFRAEARRASVRRCG